MPNMEGPRQGGNPFRGRTTTLENRNIQRGIYVKSVWGGDTWSQGKSLQSFCPRGGGCFVRGSRKKGGGGKKRQKNSWGGGPNPEKGEKKWRKC